MVGTVEQSHQLLKKGGQRLSNEASIAARLVQLPQPLAQKWRWRSFPDCKWTVLGVPGCL